MRTSHLLAVVLGVLAAVAVPAFAQSDTKPTTNTGPTEYNGKTLKEWVAEIEYSRANSDPGLRVRAIQAVQYFEQEKASKEASASLIKCISDPDTSIRVNSLIALAMIGVHPDSTRDALAALVKQIDDQQSIVRLYVVILLGEMDADARDAIPLLVRRAQDPASYEIRRAAVVALARVGAAEGKNQVDMKAVGILRALISGQYADRSVEVRLAAVTALGLMGVPINPQDKAVMVSALEAGMKDSSKIIQIWSRVSLMKVDGIKEEYLKELGQVLKGSDGAAKVEAIKAIGAVGPKAAKVCFKDVAELLHEKDLGLIVLATITLAEWGDVSTDAVPMLKKLHDSKDTDERIKPILKEAMDRIQGKKKP
jgi:HEAT repeat protein